MTQTQVILLIMLALVVLYPLSMRVVAEIVQPYRLQFADKARDLLAEDRLKARERRAVKSMIENAFDFRVMISLVGLVPVFFVGSAFGLISKADCEPSHDEFFDRCKEIIGLHTWSIAAANPLFFVIFAIEIIIFGAIFGAFNAIISVFKPGSRGVERFDPAETVFRVMIRADRKLAT